MPATDDKPRGCGLPFIWITLLSILLCWLPAFGPFLAGFVGGRSARKPGLALLAAMVPAAAWAGLMVLASPHEVKVGGAQYSLGPLQFLAPLTAACIVAGALVGAQGWATRLLGALVLAAGVALFYPHARDVWGTVQTLAPAPQAPAPQQASGGETCPDRLHKLYTGIMLYTSDWDDTMPPAERWMTVLTDPTQPKAEEPTLHCPQVTGGYGYAMDDSLSSKPIGKIPDRAKATLVYDSSNMAKDAHDPFTSLPKPGRHDGKDNVLYADGRLGSVEPR